MTEHIHSQVHTPVSQEWTSVSPFPFSEEILHFLLGLLQVLSHPLFRVKSSEVFVLGLLSFYFGLSLPYVNIHLDELQATTFMNNKY